MAKPRVEHGGGLAAVRYSMKMARRAGGVKAFYKALRAPNTCKACALGMGGITGGMLNEAGERLQVCKKSMQAQAQDMQPGIPAEFFAEHSIADLAKFSGRELEALGRLAQPLYLPEGATHFQVIDWAAAYERLLDNWQKAEPERSFIYTSGRSSMEAAFLVQLLARQWGTNNINNCSYYCHQASGVGLAQSLGGGTSTVTLADIQKSDLFVLIGANPASNHPRLLKSLLELRRRGGKIVVVNPLQELGLKRFKIPSDSFSMLLGSDIATDYLQPHCGGDLALLKAAAVYLWREKKADIDFLKAHCNGLDDFRQNLESEDLAQLVEQAGISMPELEAFCRTLSESENTIFSWAMGITHQRHGVESVQAIANLALLLGMVGKPGAGLLPLRGHSNVQGVGTVGVVPQLKPAMADALLKELKIQLPETPGKDTFACLQAAQAGEIDFTLLLGGNLYSASPDLKWASTALGRIDFTAFMSTTMNLGHVHGRGKNSLILPVRARDEEPQSTSQESMFNFVRLSRGGEKAPADEMPAESEILIRVGRSLLPDSPVAWSAFSAHEKIRETISRAVPGLQAIVGLEKNTEFTIPDRIRHTPEFATKSGKANLAVLTAVDARPAAGEFNLMTLRSEGQFNTIVYEEEDLYRGVSHRMVVLMNAVDIERLSFVEGDWVWVESKVGRMKVELISAPIRPGNLAMYFPEANEIVPAEVDPQSKTPVFKRVAVRVEAVQ